MMIIENNKFIDSLILFERVKQIVYLFFMIYAQIHKKNNYEY